MERRLFATGFAMAIPEGSRCQLRPRSGLALQPWADPAQHPGHDRQRLSRASSRWRWSTSGPEPVRITRGMRIAQMLVARVEPAGFREVETLPPTGRGQGGFGSTGH